MVDCTCVVPVGSAVVVVLAAEPSAEPAASVVPSVCASAEEDWASCFAAATAASVARVVARLGSPGKLGSSMRCGVYVYGNVVSETKFVADSSRIERSWLA